MEVNCQKGETQNGRQPKSDREQHALHTLDLIHMRHVIGPVAAGAGAAIALPVVDHAASSIRCEASSVWRN